MASVHGEHVPGTPVHYRHGWVPVTPVVKHKTREEIHRAAEAKKWNREHPPKPANIVSVWKQATEQDKEDGLNWYKDANFVAEALAKHAGVSVNQAAGILATYSPQTAWASNMLRAARVLRQKKGVGGKGAPFMATGAQRDRADRILAGEDWHKVLTGQKISAFADLIEHGGDADPANPKVVVDRHALSVASGSRASVDSYAFSKLGTKGKYNKVAQTYVDAAKEISKIEGKKISPHQVQAVTWLVQQRLNQIEDMLSSQSKKSSRSAKQAKNAWAEWRAFAEKYFPELLDETPETGYFDPVTEVAQEIGLSVPYYGAAEQPNQTVQVQPPPDASVLTQQVVQILLAGYSVSRAAAAIGALLSVPAAVVTAVIEASGGASGHRAHARLQSLELEPSSSGAATARSAARHEIFYRAAYIVNASKRVGADVGQGTPIPQAVAEEKRFFRSHEAARRRRMDAAAAVGAAANRYGPLLGWYLNPLLNNEAECIAANGHNFRADEGTAIGWPGAVHLNCGCVAGPPIAGAGMVNDALEAAKHVELPSGTYRLRRTA